MVRGLEQVLLAQVLLGGVDAPREQRCVQDRVDLVEGEPVLHPAAVPVEEHPDIPLVEPDEVAGDPAVVRLGEVQRGLVVRDRDQWLDAVLLQFVQDAVVEGQALLVRLEFVALREDPAPRDGEPEDGESHLGEERDVLGVPVVEVDALELEVVRRRPLCARRHDPLRHDVLDGQALAALVVGALELVRGGRATPQEGRREGCARGRGHRVSPSSLPGGRLVVCRRPCRAFCQ